MSASEGSNTDAAVFGDRQESGHHSPVPEISRDQWISNVSPNKSSELPRRSTPKNKPRGWTSEAAKSLKEELIDQWEADEEFLKEIGEDIVRQLPSDAGLNVELSENGVSILVASPSSSTKTTTISISETHLRMTESTSVSSSSSSQFSVPRNPFSPSTMAGSPVCNLNTIELEKLPSLDLNNPPPASFLAKPIDSPYNVPANLVNPTSRSTSRYCNQTKLILIAYTVLIIATLFFSIYLPIQSTLDISVSFIILGTLIGLWLIIFLVSYCRRKKHVLHASASVMPIKGPLGNVAGVSSIQGRRAYMEDTHYACTLGSDMRKAFYGVFDGHGGANASQFAAENLHKFLVRSTSFEDDPSQALTNAFLSLDHVFLDIAARHNWDDGTTAIVAIMLDGVLHVANLGDSRAVLASKQNVVEMSSDHKPNRPDERARIENLGGIVLHFGTWRVNGVLAVARAFGDRRLKPYVSGEPEIQSRAIRDEDDFLILASDGVWDVLSNDDVVDLVYQAPDPKSAADLITRTASQRGSMDNITTVVIDLSLYRSPNRTSLSSSSSSSSSSAAKAMPIS